MLVAKLPPQSEIGKINLRFPPMRGDGPMKNVRLLKSTNLFLIKALFKVV